MSRTGHRAYRAKRARLKRNSDTCWLCGKHINPDLTYPHPMSFTADHVTPVSKGGHNLGELRAAHFECNTRRGNRDPVANTIQLRDW